MRQAELLPVKITPGSPHDTGFTGYKPGSIINPDDGFINQTVTREEPGTDANFCRPILVRLSPGFV
jgi:hypothetical protein